MTRAELEARVAELEAEVKDLQKERDILGRDVEAEWMARRSAEATVERLQAKLDGKVSGNKLVTFVSTLPSRTVYRALARALHPDVGGDTRAMQDLAAAYHASK